VVGGTEAPAIGEIIACGAGAQAGARVAQEADLKFGRSIQARRRKGAAARSGDRKQGRLGTSRTA